MYSNVVYQIRKAHREGQLKRPDRCSECHVPCKPHGHHPDYSKPLDVVWLCSKCHARQHNNTGRHPLPADQRRDCEVRLYLTSAERDRLESAAEAAGQTVRDFVMAGVGAGAGTEGQE